MTEEKRFAVLIDADNVSSTYIKTILDEISGKGITTYKRIYGDWTQTQLEPWKKVLLDYSITPMQQYSYTTGKNSTDSAMIIDAMDILYSGKVEGFCLVTSDSDFTKLASRLREAGMTVIGMGEEKTPRPFVSACNEFKFIDRLYKEAQNDISEKTAETPAKGTRQKNETAQKSKAQKQETSETSITELGKIMEAITEMINDHSDDDGWLPVSDIGSLLPKRYADFDVRNYGHKKMVPFLQSLRKFEIEKRSGPESSKIPNGYYVAYVKIKTPKKKTKDENKEQAEV